jgi:hypothetical protein
MLSNFSWFRILKNFACRIAVFSADPPLAQVLDSKGKSRAIACLIARLGLQMLKFQLIVFPGVKMNKSFAAFLVALFILCSISQCFAADKAAHSSASSSEDINFGDVINGVSFTGARLVKCTMGLAVGTPIAVVRRTLRTTHETTKDITGDNKNEACSLLTEALVLPTVGVFVGGIEGLGWSVSNSWKNSEHKKPFDFKKELFSLGSLEE